MSTWTQHAEGFAKCSEPVVKTFKVVERTKQQQRIDAQLGEIEVSSIGYTSRCICSNPPGAACSSRIGAW